MCLVLSPCTAWVAGPFVFESRLAKLKPLNRVYQVYRPACTVGATAGSPATAADGIAEEPLAQ